MTSRDQILTRAAAHAQRYLAGINDRPVRATASGDDLRSSLGGALPAAGETPVAVLDRLDAAAREGTVASQGGRYFGFVIGGSLPVATGAYWLVSAWDQNAGLFVLSPAVSVIEDTVLGWVRQIVGLPETWNGGFVTGCQMATFTALATARLHVLREAGWDVEANGLQDAPPIDVIVSDEAHYTVFRALRMLGLGDARARRVPTDGQGRMRAAELAAMVAGQEGPCIISAQAGNVNTGAFDPLGAIADVAKSRGAWLHVDGAFGLWAAASPSLAGAVEGIAQADSISTDGHKWLNVPYDSGIVLCADRAALRAAMTLHAPYIEESAVERDPHEYVPDESRRARAVPIYAALRALGTDGLRALVEGSCERARQMADRLRGQRGVTVLNDVVLNQVLVRFAPDADGDADEHTREVIARVQAEGTCWLGSTTWQGQAAMRISVSNWSTSADDIDRSAQAILSAHAATRS